MNTKKLLKLLLILLVVVAGGCGVSVPPQAPLLSEELGMRINELEKANINLLRKFFDLKREQVDEFVLREWLPIFADKVFDRPFIQQTWVQIVDAKASNQDRVEFIRKLGPGIMDELTKKSDELKEPLKKLEAQVTKDISTEYTNARRINDQITALLQSASNITKDRNEFLALVQKQTGIQLPEEEKIWNTIDQTDKVVANLTGYSEEVYGIAQQVKNTEKKTEEYLQNIHSLIK